jgi:hypothetical protein
MGNDRAPIQRSLAQLRPFNPPTLRFFDTSPDPPNTSRDPFSDRGGDRQRADGEKNPNNSPSHSNTGAALDFDRIPQNSIERGRLPIVSTRSTIKNTFASRDPVRRFAIPEGMGSINGPGLPGIYFRDRKKKRTKKLISHIR